MTETILERSQLFFVDMGSDKPAAYLKLYVKLFDLKECKLKVHAPDGTVYNTGLLIDYYEPTTHGVAMEITPRNCPIAPQCRREDQLFTLNEQTGESLQNSKAIRRLLDEATLYQAFEIVGPNIFKITICESRYLGIPAPNKWTPYVANRVIDRNVVIQRGLLELLK